MTIKIISNAPSVMPSNSLFKQAGGADAGAIDLFSSLLGGQLGELDSLLGDTLNKTTLLSEDAALSPLARKLKALKENDIAQDTATAAAPAPDANLAAMLSAAALLPLPARLPTSPAQQGQDVLTESSQHTTEAEISTDLLVGSKTLVPQASAQAVRQSGEASSTETAAAVANGSNAWVDPRQANAPSAGQHQNQPLTAEQAVQKPRADLAVTAELPSRTAAELAASGQKSRQEAADFTLALKEAATETTSTTAPLASDGRQIQVAVPSAQRGAPQHVITIQTPVGQPQWSDDVGQQVVVMMNSRLETAQLQVTPPDMGPVEISLKMGNDGSAQLSFVSGVAETRQALEQGLPRLSAMLADNGIRLADAQVSSGQGQAFRDTQQFAQQGQTGQQGQPGGRPATAQELLAAGLPADTVAVNMPIPSSEVSIYA